jgi:hypothetical protein
MAGVIFEAIVQSRLQDKMSLEFVRMVKLDGSAKRKRSSSETKASRPRWHSSHISLRDNNKLEEIHQDAKRESGTVTINPPRSVEFGDDGLEKIDKNVLYIPAASNHKAIDSFILLDDTLYLFQITIASHQDINLGLIGVSQQYGFPPMEKWCYVFIIPSNLILTVPQLNGGLQALKLYSAVMDPAIP